MAGAIQVRNAAEFADAVAALRERGGTIRLRRHVYRGELVVPARSARPLRIVGEPGVRVESLLLDHTQHVSVERMTIGPVTDDAVLGIQGSRHIEVRDVLVTAERTRLQAKIRIRNSSHVVVRDSEFRRCGDRSPHLSNCLHLKPRTRHIRIVGNWFHDCRGCDFLHGLFGYDLTVRGNRFERALPCRMRSRYRCGHQDLVSLSSGHRLRIEGNTFGVYKLGAAQVYLIGKIDRVLIVNNVFLGTDPRVPGYRARVALIIGSRGFRRVPQHVAVINNTILTGARRIDGYAGSIRMSGVYWGLQPRKRPLLANNVIGLLEDPHHVCSVARAAVSNVVLRGTACRGSNRSAEFTSTQTGVLRRPRRCSSIRRAHAMRPRSTSRDAHAGANPDIGAYEYRCPVIATSRTPRSVVRAIGVTASAAQEATSRLR